MIEYHPHDKNTHALMLMPPIPESPGHGYKLRSRALSPTDSSDSAASTKTFWLSHADVVYAPAPPASRPHVPAYTAAAPAVAPHPATAPLSDAALQYLTQLVPHIPDPHMPRAWLSSAKLNAQQLAHTRLMADVIPAHAERISDGERDNVVANIEDARDPAMRAAILYPLFLHAVRHFTPQQRLRLLNAVPPQNADIARLVYASRYFPPEARHAFSLRQAAMAPFESHAVPTMPREQSIVIGTGAPMRMDDILA